MLKPSNFPQLPQNNEPSLILGDNRKRIVVPGKEYPGSVVETALLEVALRDAMGGIKWVRYIDNGAPNSLKEHQAMIRMLIREVLDQRRTIEHLHEQRAIGQTSVEFEPEEDDQDR